MMIDDCFELRGEEESIWDAVTRQLKAAAKMKWQPIETAPKDAAILLYANHAFEIGRFNASPRIDNWVANWDHRPLKNATHWMPLPAPPEAAVEK